MKFYSQSQIIHICDIFQFRRKYAIIKNSTNGGEMSDLIVCQNRIINSSSQIT